ncbi:MAG: hypothetical protein EOO82_02665 [Oxalobacteraceae bacterium]|nr:MAG: hypothetical protein EOO82_02665 [Oxalobacteraceae bacterium]
MSVAPRLSVHQSTALTLRDKIENAAMACEEIALACTFLSRSESICGDLSGALRAISRLSRRNADDIDDLVSEILND